MKKGLLVLLLIVTFTLTGCEQVEDTVTDLQSKLTTVTEDLNTAVDTIEDLDETLETANETITALQTSIDEADAALEASEARIAELEAEVALTNTKIKNALNRDNWAVRQVMYDPVTYAPSNAEFCFGVFDEDWSTITADDYTHGEGLTFVLTIEEVMSSPWSTEIYAKDSCGNYSEFILDASSYGLYSVPADIFVAGETYNVVLYKEMYFTSYQLGLLPLDEMGEYGAYPTDLSGIVVTKVGE